MSGRFAIEIAAPSKSAPALTLGLWCFNRVSVGFNAKKNARHPTTDAWRARYQRLPATLRFRFRIFHAEVILHWPEAESGRGCSHVGDLLFQVAIHNAFQRHVAVLHDNVNWRHSLNGVARKRRVAIN